MLTTYDELLARIRTLVAESVRPPVVAIAGHGGAGRSTLALRLAEDLGVHEDQVVRTDAIYAKTDTGRAGMLDPHDWPRIATSRRPSCVSLGHEVGAGGTDGDLGVVK